MFAYSLTYLFTVMAGFFSFVYFRILNWTTVRGKENIPKKNHGVLILSNNLSMYDSFLVALVMNFPKILIYPSFLPFHLAARENYFVTPVIKSVLKMLRVLPVERGKFNRKLLESAGAKLREGNLHMFYQGTRSRDLRLARGGPAFLISSRNGDGPLTVLPIYIEGTDRLFGGGPGIHKGLGRWFPRFPFFGRKALVVFGPTIDFSDIVESGSKPDHDAITARIVASISALQTKILAARR